MAVLDVIITTKNRRPQLQKSLESLAALEDREAIGSVAVVDDGSSDDTPEYLSQATLPYPLRVLRNEQSRGPAWGRNRGVEGVRSPFVWFVDDDVAVVPEAAGEYTRHLASHSMERASAVGTVEQVAEAMTPFEFWLFNGGSQFIQCRIPPDRWLDAGEEQFCTANLVVPAAILRAHGFDESFAYPRYEDRELGYRLRRLMDHRIHLVPKARAIHLKRYAFKDWLTAFERFTECALHFSALHPEDRDLRELLGIGRAERLAALEMEPLDRALETIRDQQERFFTHPEVRPQVFEAFRNLQELFRLTYLRRWLQLPELVDPATGLSSQGALERVLRGLPPGT